MTASAQSQSSSYGPASVTPERLLSFSRSPMVGGAVQTAPTNAAGDQTRYRFRINPDRLTTRHDVNEKYTLTQFGYERQDWGNGLSIFQYSGNTGVFRPDVTAADFASRFPGGGFDIRQTKAWQAFQAFETFYRVRGPNVFMHYDAYDHEWEGSLSGFSFERSAQNPFHITYSFTFTGLPFDYPSTQITVANTTTSQASQQSMAAGSSPSLSPGIDTNPW
jgi:hypothetical protein